MFVQAHSLWTCNRNGNTLIPLNRPVIWRDQCHASHLTMVTIPYLPFGGAHSHLASLSFQGFSFSSSLTFGHCQDQLIQPVKCTIAYISSVHMPLNTKKPGRPQCPMSRKVKLFAPWCQLFSEWSISNKWCQTTPLLMLPVMGCPLLFASSIADLYVILKATLTAFFTLVKGFWNLTLGIQWR